MMPYNSPCMAWLNGRYIPAVYRCLVDGWHTVCVEGRFVRVAEVVAPRTKHRDLPVRRTA